MKYTIKHDKSNNKWHVFTKNSVLTYSTVFSFDTKTDAQQYINDEIAYSNERMKDVVSIADYFKVQK